jgi:hypothetical protein
MNLCHRFRTTFDCHVGPAEIGIGGEGNIFAFKVPEAQEP